MANEAFSDQLVEIEMSIRKVENSSELIKARGIILEPPNYIKSLPY